MNHYVYPAAIILRVTDQHSARYLNARLSNDIKLLTVGSTLKAAALNAQGRVEGVFNVLRLAELEFLLLADGGDSEQVISAFRRFIVADKVRVQDESAVSCLVHISAEDLKTALPILDLSEVPRPKQFTKSGRYWVLQHSRLGTPGIDVICPTSIQEELLAALTSIGSTSLSRSEYTLNRLRAGSASFPEEINSEAILPEFGQLDLVSYTKGCYAGQEIVEKVDARGKPARNLVLIETTSPLEILPLTPIEIRREGNTSAVGKVLSASIDQVKGVTLVFGLLKNDDQILASSLSIAGVGAKILRSFGKPHPSK